MGFVAFNNLPAEIRSMVWAYALPEPRVYEILDTPFSTLKTPASTGLMFSSSSHDAPPVLAAVCRESRAFVLRRYRPLTLSDTIKYIDPSRDIILLQPYLLIKRLLRTLHELNRKPTNDDWRRFKRRFLKAVHSTLMRGLLEKPRREHLPFLIEGASLLWRYEAS
ncbi:hypothetical protein FOC4_g10015268 [Fusarium odoratissimum]|uniref:2EXR domain-containing protein n=1 Tax=Fusarium oxysporum f. sp. cubense (strain race 4) TaxID=2502994 RepID=N1RCX9_FUSC4|nr:hypothetical protein FOC4_g10015268 [Fusarium odoratissimum]